MKANDILSRLFIVLSLLASFLLFSVTVKADNSPEPQNLVQRSIEKMLLELEENEGKIAKDPDAIFELVETILMPNFDFAKMAKLALGKNWRKTTAEQKQRFTKEFRLLLVRTYSTAMLEYANEEIRFLPFKGDLKKKKVKVKMEMIQPGGPSIPMALSMYLNNDTGWKVYDVKIDGISLITSYRSTFSSQIRNNGMDKLIESLASRNEKVKA
jgi:phospholipid transport system substrate-binding protein